MDDFKPFPANILFLILGFMFSGGIKKEHWPKIGSIYVNVSRI